MKQPLPDNWIMASLGDALELKYGKGLSSYDRRSGKISVFGSNGIIGVTNTPLTAGPTIIIGRKGSFGEVLFSEEPCWPIDTTYYVDEFFGQSPEFWHFYLKYLPLKQFDRSSAVPGLRRGDAIALTVNVPPAPEQRRIARRLEDLLSRFRNAGQWLDQAQYLLSSFQITLLESAVSGALTRQWRRALEDSKKLTPPVSQRPIDRAAALPTTWKWIRVGDAGEVQLGRQRSPKYHTGDQMRPYLRVANVFENEIDTRDVMEMHFSDSDFETYRLRSGDILLNEGQSAELVGRPAIFQDEVEGACFTNTLIRFRSNALVNPRFALIVFRHYLHSGEFKKVAKITTNLAHLGASRFASMPFPLPPLAEQAEIVRRVHDYAVTLDRLGLLRTDLTLRLSQAERLVLDRAFVGALIPQEPLDEPAGLLLPRIRTLREAARTRPKPVVVRSERLRQIVPVRQALSAASRPLSAQDLFSEAGYPNDAPADLVERFFLDLREQLAAGVVSRQRIQDEDIFTLEATKP